MKRRHLLLNFIFSMLMYFCYTSLACLVYILILCTEIEEVISKWCSLLQFHIHMSVWNLIVSSAAGTSNNFWKPTLDTYKNNIVWPDWFCFDNCLYCACVIGLLNCWLGFHLYTLGTLVLFYAYKYTNYSG